MATNLTFYIVCFIIVIILLVLWIMSSVKEGFSSDILTGYWEANDEFLEKNNISKFAMAIGPNENSKRIVYIIMQDLNGKILINDKKEMQLTSKWSSLSPFGVYNKKVKYSVKMDTNSSIIPEKLDMIYDITAGFISLYDQDTIYAELYKNNMLSDLDIEHNDSDD